MSRSDNDRRWEERGNRAYDSATAHPLRWVVGIVVLFIVTGVAFGAIRWIGSWGSEAARVTGVENTRTQTTQVLEDENSMIAAAGNVCDVTAANKNSKQSDDDSVTIEGQVVAYRATYRKIKVDYDRRMGNLFEAAATRHNPLPDTINHLPKTAPTLEERIEAVC